MEIKKNNKKGIVSYSIDDDLDMHSAISLDKIVEKDIKNGITKLIIDLQQCFYIDSSGIGVLIKINKELQRLKGVLILFKMSNNIKSLFKSTNLLLFFNVAENDADIDKFLNKR